MTLEGLFYDLRFDAARIAARPGVHAGGRRDAGARHRVERHRVHGHGRDAVSRLSARQAERPAGVSAGARIHPAPCCIPTRISRTGARRRRSFEGMAFVGGRRHHVSRRRRTPDRHAADARVSANTFGLLGVPPMLGRDFVPADEMPGAAPVAILSYRFWESRFGKRADIVGLTVQINGAPATIIGVMPEGFDFPLPAEICGCRWRTRRSCSRGIRRQVSWRSGACGTASALQEARAELETINRRLEAAYPATNRGLVPTVITHSEAQQRPRRADDLRLAVGGGVVRAADRLRQPRQSHAGANMGRWREFSTRIALGAGQGRMMRQMLVESLMLAGVAGALGWWITELERARVGARPPRPATRSSTTRWIPARSPTWWRSPSSPAICVRWRRSSGSCSWA